VTAFTAALLASLSPEHAAHGWAPKVEIDIFAEDENAGYEGTAAVMCAFIHFGTYDTGCPCGMDAISHTGPRTYGRKALDLIASLTGITFSGELR
jgi:hypothetical protein